MARCRSGAFKRLAETFTIKEILATRLGVGLKLGQSAIMFTAIAEAARGPKIFDRISSASA